MKNYVTKTIRWFLSVFFIAFFVYYIWKHWGEFHNALNASRWHLIGLMVFIFVAWFSNGIQTFLILREARVKVGFWENMAIMVAMYLLNHLPMRFGSLTRMQYFKTVHSFEYSKFTGVVAFRTFILIITTGSLGIIGILGYHFTGVQIELKLFIVFLLMVVISGIIFFAKPNTKTQKNNFLSRSTHNFLSIFQSFKTSPKIVSMIIFMVIIQYFSLSIRLYISFDSIGVMLPVWAYFILAPTTTLISFFSLTPGSLGLREWFIGSISYMIGINFENGIFAGTLDRAVLILCIFFFGFISLLFVWHKMRNFQSE